MLNYTHSLSVVIYLWCDSLFILFNILNDDYNLYQLAKTVSDIDSNDIIRYR